VWARIVHEEIFGAILIERYGKKKGVKMISTYRKKTTQDMSDESRIHGVFIS